MDGHVGFLRGVPREQLAVDVRFAHAAGDQLRILCTEIEDSDGIVGHSIQFVISFSLPQDCWGVQV